MSDNDFAALTSDSDAAQDTTNTEQDASDVKSTRPAPTSLAIISHYSFEYPKFRANSDVPNFVALPVWTAMSSHASHPLVKLACICLSMAHKFSEEEAVVMLKEVTTLDLKKTVPRDITVELNGIKYLLFCTPSIAAKWHTFGYPKDKNILTYHPDDVPPKAKSPNELPYNVELDAAPTLDKTVHQGVPSHTAQVVPTAWLIPLKVHFSQEGKVQGLSVAEIEDESDREEEPTPKCTKFDKKSVPVASSSPGPSGCSLRSRGKGNKKAATSKPKNNPHTTSLNSKINKLIPLIHDTLTEMLDEKKKTGFCFIDSPETKLTVTLSTYQGNRLYVPQKERTKAYQNARTVQYAKLAA
ncbi:hypothetical protein B0H14DRAFT_3491923 [Mycena olivaceomarginata]|nr:hypothetical protein B0H14DRAFT_3491923 [Mycena olivaceomarginata]